MLDKLDLNRKIKKDAYKRAVPLLESRLFELQKLSWDAHLPVALVFEGWDAAGKGTSIRKLTEPLDPRGYKLYPIRAPRTYEKKRPWLWRFWTKIPAHGEWAIYDRSWYGRVLVERIDKLTPEAEWRRGYRDITDFEHALADDGALILKFFLHISKSEQKKRFNAISKDPLEAWRVTSEDWDHHYRYDDWVIAYEEAFERTDTEWGPWIIVEATQRRFTTYKIFHSLVTHLEERLGLPHLALPLQDEAAEDDEADNDSEDETDESEAAVLKEEAEEV